MLKFIDILSGKRYQTTQEVVVLVANKNFIQQVRSVIGGLRRVGNWKGDICILSPDIEDDDIAAENCFVVNVLQQDIFSAKYNIYHPFFCSWQAVLYLDCDIMIINPISALLDLSAIDTNPHIYAESDRNDSKNLTLEDYFPSASPEDLLHAKNEFNITTSTTQAFNSGVVCFNPKLLGDTKPQLINSLINFRTKYSRLAPAEWTDQQAQNFCLLNLWNDIDKYVCYWKLYLHGLVELEDVCILHFFRWHYPWNVYAIHAPSRKSFKNLYQENLEYFRTLTNMQRL
jgi:lipopolysaccharide biosynthesis glycosyltransferase